MIYLVLKCIYKAHNWHEANNDDDDDDDDNDDDEEIE